MNLLLTFFTALAVFSGVKSDTNSSSSSEIDWSAHQWQAPGSSDSRGPCPGLNTLANHGFLPRNGSNITIPVALQAIYDGFNFRSPGIIGVAAKLGLLTTDAEDSFSLSDLALHGTLEHDVSLSRNDYALGDNIHFNETVFTTLANSNPGVDYYNITSGAQVLDQRLAEDNIVNPSLVNTIKEFSVRTLETAFYLSAMGNGTTGVAPKNFVQIFFREERLPLEEGWKRPDVVIDDTTLDNISDSVQNASNWAPSGEVICPWIRLQPEGEAIIVQG